MNCHNIVCGETESGCLWACRIQKRKVDGRAAKLVKMAHTTARAARQDTDGAVRKVKFRLPAALGMEKVVNFFCCEAALCLRFCLLLADPELVFSSWLFWTARWFLLLSCLYGHVSWITIVEVWAFLFLAFLIVLESLIGDCQRAAREGLWKHQPT